MMRKSIFLLMLFVATAAHAQLTADFRAWLKANGYASWDFERGDVAGGSYGGRTSKKQKVVNEPVIFIHGNSDSALGTSAPLTGWRASIEFFKTKGYTSAELYATTWGPADKTLASEQVHSKEYLARIRAFIEAVKAYTGAAKVDVVAHSMGVTLARKAIQGGGDLGPALTSAIDTFVGIAGANRGLALCAMSPAPTCNNKDGFSPVPSEILAEMNATSHYEGAHVYTIWSSADTLIGFGTMVYGQSTCRINGQDGEVTYDAAPYGHFGVKDLTAETQWRMVTGSASVPLAGPAASRRR